MDIFDKLLNNLESTKIVDEYDDDDVFFILKSLGSPDASDLNDETILCSFYGDFYKNKHTELIKKLGSDPYYLFDVYHEEKISDLVKRMRYNKEIHDNDEK
jgi:hypothetical protein